MENNDLFIPKLKKKHLISVRLVESSMKTIDDAQSLFGLTKTEAIEAALKLLESEMKNHTKEQNEQ